MSPRALPGQNWSTVLRNQRKPYSLFSKEETKEHPFRTALKWVSGKGRLAWRDDEIEEVLFSLQRMKRGARECDIMQSNRVERFLNISHKIQDWYESEEFFKPPSMVELEDIQFWSSMPPGMSVAHPDRIRATLVPSILHLTKPSQGRFSWGALEAYRVRQTPGYLPLVLFFHGFSLHDMPNTLWGQSWGVTDMAVALFNSWHYDLTKNMGAHGMSYACMPLSFWEEGDLFLPEMTHDLKLAAVAHMKLAWPFLPPGRVYSSIPKKEFRYLDRMRPWAHPDKMEYAYFGRLVDG